jgi:kynurenine formamidase
MSSPPAHLGISAFANPGIVTRGVVLDMVATLADASADGHLPPELRIKVSDIQACLEQQQLTLERGDGVLIYTGFSQRLVAAGTERDELENTDAGLDSSTMPYWAERQIAFLASDNLAVEAIPIDFGIHAGALRDLGLPLGELWALDELVAACRQEQRYDFLFVSAPLNIPGGFGSPANALAIF